MAVLRSSRLVLSPFVFADAAELFRIRSDTEAMIHWDWPVDASIEETQHLAHAMLDETRTGNARIWTARHADNSDFVGIVDLSEIGERDADLGFMIERRFWGQGFAFEAASQVIEEARTLGLVRLGARIHAGNGRSKRLLERLGFQPREERDMEIRPGVVRRCRFFALEISAPVQN